MRTEFENTCKILYNISRLQCNNRNPIDDAKKQLICIIGNDKSRYLKIKADSITFDSISKMRKEDRDFKEVRNGAGFICTVSAISGTILANRISDIKAATLLGLIILFASVYMISCHVFSVYYFRKYRYMINVENYVKLALENIGKENGWE